jgi:hypothetical protein
MLQRRVEEPVEGLGEPTPAVGGAGPNWARFCARLGTVCLVSIRIHKSTRVSVGRGRGQIPMTLKETNGADDTI